MNAHALDPLLHSRFPLNTSVGSLLNQLAVEEWDLNINYSSYYHMCNPVNCTYTYVKRTNYINILTTIIELVGGLTTTLRITTPLIIATIRRMKKTSGVLIDDEDIKIERETTRLFLMLFSTTFSVLIVYTIISKRTRITEVKLPTLSEYERLQQTYSDSLHCPCSQLAVKYSEFIHIYPSFHQVCSSIFITNEWFDSLYVQFQELYLDDFRLSGAPLFRVLATFCQLANDTIADALVRFYSIDYITPTVVPLSLFNPEIESITNIFKKQVPNTFTRSFSMMRDSIHLNQLFTSVVTELQWNQTTSKVTSTIGQFQQTDGSICSCLNNSKCLGEMNIRDEDRILLFVVPNFFRGCYLIDGLLSSTLECLYNDTCLTIIKSHTQYNIDVLPLNSSLSTAYQSSTKINDIVLNLMVEIWNTNISYGAYYLTCKPEYCHYTINTRNDHVYVLTTAIGLVGGLLTVFQIITPYLIIIRTKIKSRCLPVHVRFSVKAILRFIHTKIVEFNLFESTLSSDEDIRYERRTTRLYIILLTVTLYVLTVYNAVLQRTKTTLFDAPSLLEYLELRDKYSQNFECHCSHLFVKYDKFIQLQPIYHQLCSSVFITQEWIDHLSNNNDILYYTSQFQALALLCKLANHTISEALEQFYSTYVIRSTLYPPPLLKLKTSSFVDKFQTRIANSFLQTFHLIQDSIVANQFISAYGTNFRFYIKDNDYAKNPNLGVESIKYNSGQCDCARMSTCIEPAVLNKTIVPGFYIGCLPIETILQSSLECLYNQTCVTMISAGSDVSAINTTWPTSQFHPNTTIEYILSKLMIEQWNIESLFDNYYNECSPKYCTYTYIQRYDLLVVSTTIIGLFGGLTTAFEFILPILVDIIRRLSRRKTSSNVAKIESLIPADVIDVYEQKRWVLDPNKIEQCQ
ncbi:unnamed protein product, partial [Didymodactylos carnosus]